MEALSDQRDSNYLFPMRLTPFVLKSEYWSSCSLSPFFSPKSLDASRHGY